MIENTQHDPQLTRYAVKGKTREFLAEAADLLGVMDREIMHLARGLNSGGTDPGALNGLFRSVHTLKGLSSVFEFDEITRLCHAFEDRLDAMRLGRCELDGPALEAVTAAQALIGRLVDSCGSDAPAAEVDAVIEALREGCGAGGDGCSGGISDEEGIFTSLTEYENYRLRENIKAGRRIFMVCASTEPAEFDRVHGELIRAIEKTGEVIATLPGRAGDEGAIAFEVLVGAGPGEADLEGSLCGLPVSGVRELRCSTPGRSRLGRLRTGEAPRRRKRASVDALRRNSGTIRVDIEKIEGLLGCLEELHDLKARLRRIAAMALAEGEERGEGGELRSLEKRCDEVFERLRESILAVKMVRIGRLFRRFEPYIERLAAECRKEIGITTYGSDTEIDMSVIEELADPMMHIIRNVIDHGIERPAERTAAGKPSAGVITLSAYQKGGKVVIEVKDDGRGMDPDLICERALREGFIDRAEAAGLGRREKLDLIFLPGFTTSEEIGPISGRGVGLDVVRENIAMLNGQVEVETVKGKGTRFVLTIPVDQTMIGALLCEDGGNSFAIPGSAVCEITMVRDREALKQGFLTIDGTCMRAVRPSELFNSSVPEPGPRMYAVVASAGPSRVCLLVERVGVECNMIMRPLPFEKDVSGILGLAEGPENETTLVLDIPALMESLSIIPGREEEGERGNDDGERPLRG